MGLRVLGRPRILAKLKNEQAITASKNVFIPWVKNAIAPTYVFTHLIEIVLQLTNDKVMLFGQ